MTGRPQKNTVDYFPHYAGASNGRTMFIIESQYGNNGYAFWFKLLELLSSSKGHYYDYNKRADLEFLLAKTRVSVDIFTNILKTLVVLGAIDEELHAKNILWCQNLVDNLAPLYERRKSLLPQKPSLCMQKDEPLVVSDDNNGIDDTSNTQSKVKYSKVKKRIKDDKKLSSPIGLKIKEVFERVDKLRGYRPPKRKAEAASIIRMLKTYTPDQIIETWQKLKEDKFWQTKELFMMSVESQIGAVVNNESGKPEGKYNHMVR